MLNNILLWDRQLTDLVNNLLPHNVFLNGFFEFLSGYGSSVLIWFIIVGLLVVFEEKRHHEFIRDFVVSIGAGAILTNMVLKNLFQRLRPPLLADLHSCPVDFSFPSGHATVAFAAALILAKYDQKRAFLYYLLAILISLSRIYLGCHYLLDVVAGAIIGYFTATLIMKLNSQKLS